MGASPGTSGQTVAAANTLFVVDDEADVGEVVVRAARKVGFTAELLTDPKRLNQMLAVLEPTVLVLDLRMPGYDGVEMLRDLARRGLKSQILFISGMDQRTLSSAERLGISHGLNVIGSLRKPFPLEALRELLGKAMKPPPTVTEEDLATAIKEDQFFLEYQPKVNLTSGRVLGAEALARWKRPDHGVVPPMQFIPQLETSPLLQPFTLAVLRSATQQLRTWAETGHKVTIAVNVGAGLVSDLTVPDTFMKEVEGQGCGSGDVILEVTETGAMADALKSVEVLTRLRLKGFHLSVDDFGTGYSSMQQLHRMPFNEIKVDRSFVSEMNKSREAALIVRSITDLGHNMGLQVCAEGVEDRETHEKLVELGVDLAQGYLYGKPMAAQMGPDAWSQSATRAVS